jgi:hypothetical protein
MMRRRDVYVVVLAWGVFLSCCAALWFWDTIVYSKGDFAYWIVAPLLILGITGSLYWVGLSALSAAVWVCTRSFDSLESAYVVLCCPAHQKLDRKRQSVRLAWLAFVICLANSAWVAWYYPPWNQLDEPRAIDFASGKTVYGFALGIALIVVMAVCQWWVLPSVVRALIHALEASINAAIEEHKREAEDRRAENELRWYHAIEELERGTTLPQEEWLDFSESAKNALLDLAGGEWKEPEPWPAPLPPLGSEAVQQLRARVNVTLAALLAILNQSATGDVPAADLPRVKQLFKDLQHDLLEIGRQSRVEAACAQLPAPQGHWAERYRQMKKDAALHPSETSQNDPSHN